MIDDGVFDGDTVIIREQHTADNGQMVVAIIDDNQATLKRIYKEKNRIRLQPANQSLLPLFRTEVEIRGVVEKIIRNLNTQVTEKYDFKILPTPKVEIASNDEIIFITQEYKLNKIYNIDCLELTKKIKDNSVDLIFADPPYNLSGSNFKMKFTKSGGTDLNTNKGKWDHYSDLEFEEFTKPLFNRIRNNELKIVYSSVTEDELDSAPERVKQLVRSLPVESIEFVELQENVVELATMYIKENVVGKTSFDDCLHIALATIHKADYLVSWNFKHIVNVERIRGYNSVNIKLGYSTIDIRSPRELMKYEE